LRRGGVSKPLVEGVTGKQGKKKKGRPAGLDRGPHKETSATPTCWAKSAMACVRELWGVVP